MVMDEEDSAASSHDGWIDLWGVSLGGIFCLVKQFRQMKGEQAGIYLVGGGWS